MSDKNKEIVLASEEVSRKNILACVEHANATRKIVRVLEEHILTLQNTVLTFQRQIAELRKQLSFVQTKLYKGGTS